MPAKQLPCLTLALLATGTDVHWIEGMNASSMFPFLVSPGRAVSPITCTTEHVTSSGQHHFFKNGFHSHLFSFKFSLFCNYSFSL